MDNGSGLLLSAFCNGSEILVIDNTSVNNKEIFTPEILKTCLFISHNADFEARWGVQLDFLPGRFACTMVNEKRLLSGQDGFRYGLIPTISRRLGYKHIPVWMDKDLREQFRDCKFFTDELILYNAGDTIKLIPLYYKQLEEAEKLGQSFLLKTINSRIIIPIAQAEVRGIKHKSDTWIEIARDRETKAKAICQELNEIVINQYGLSPGMINPVLRKKQESQEKAKIKKEERIIKLQTQLGNLEKKEKTHLKSYRVSLEQLDKLLSTTQELEQEDTGLINWGSQKQVLATLETIGCPIPQAKNNKIHKIQPSLSKEGRANWFVEYENNSFEPFMKKFDNYKKLQHNITSFGESWVEKYVRPNGRCYTIFRQADTETGRFSSGDRKAGYFNIQQIPSSKEYRSCFMADDQRSLITCDYSNAEGVIVIALSGDLAMKGITELKDQHSALGTIAYRRMYHHRYLRTGDPKWKELSENYTMGKDTVEREKERSKFKNSAGLFPCLYGVHNNKVAATAQVTEDEAGVMIQAVKDQVPGAVKFLDEKSKEAGTLGYVKFNSRCGGRRYFSFILEYKHYGFKLSKSEKTNAETAARNAPIQGTNASGMKEAIAMVDLWKRLYKLDVDFVLTNHDEGQWSVPYEQREWYLERISNLMCRALQNYLIPEIKIHVEGKAGVVWEK